MASQTGPIVILVITVCAIVLLIAGFASPRWMKQDFVIKKIKGKNLRQLDDKINTTVSKVGALGSSLFDKMTLDVIVSSRLALYQACKDTSLKTPSMGKILATLPKPFLVAKGKQIKALKSKFTKLVGERSMCSTHGARDWQKIALGLASFALLIALIDLVLTAMSVIGKRFRKCYKLNIAVAIFNFCAAGLVVSPVIIYVANKKIQVKPPLPLQVVYDLDWGLIVTAASAATYALLFLLSALRLVMMDGPRGKVEENGEFPLS